MDLKPLSTAQVMKKYQITRNALRLYEEMGLLSKVNRTDSGYRRFTERDIEDISFIRKAKNSGFTLNEIRDFLKVARSEKTLNCKEVSTELSKKVKEIESEISTLHEKKKFLSEFLKTCGNKSSDSECKIVQAGFEEKACC